MLVSRIEFFFKNGIFLSTWNKNDFSLLTRTIVTTRWKQRSDFAMRLKQSTACGTEFVACISFLTYPIVLNPLQTYTCQNSVRFVSVSGGTDPSEPFGSSPFSMLNKYICSHPPIGTTFFNLVRVYKCSNLSACNWKIGMGISGRMFHWFWIRTQ